jgi:hypothetical protein
LQREAAEAAAKAQLQELAERAAIEADREAVTLLCDRIRRAQLQRGGDSGAGFGAGLGAVLAERDPVEAALLYAPDTAHAAMLAAQKSAAGGLTLAALRAALVALNIKPPQHRALTPADLRAARERAEREGRSALDVLNESP